jgi:cysteine-S-conjugate beta-lyase
MTYNFDEYIERRQTNSMKWDMFRDPAYTIPMPVADMDFRVAPPIHQRLLSIAQHGVYGYAVLPQELPTVVCSMLLEKYNWAIDPDWLVWMPGMVVGLSNAAALWANSEKGILTVAPIYPPFYKAIAYAGKNLQTTALLLVNGRYTLNFEEIERSFGKNIGFFMLCNPQNPGGTVFTKIELNRLAALCVQYNVTLLSDEIHCELLLDPKAIHIPIASLNNEIMQNTITMMSPSKTYNIAGLGCTFAIIPNATLRAQFVKKAEGNWPMISRMAFEAALVAYTQCDQWKTDLLHYLKGNHALVLEKVNSLPGLNMQPLQATYLAWVNAQLQPQLYENLLENGLRLNQGAYYLQPGFLRLNFACPRATLTEGLSRLETTVLNNLA